MALVNPSLHSSWFVQWHFVHVYMHLCWSHSLALQICYCYALVSVNYYSIRATKCLIVYRIHRQAGAREQAKKSTKTVSFGCVYCVFVCRFSGWVCDAKLALSICSESSSGFNKSVSLVLRIHSHSSVRSAAAATVSCCCVYDIFFVLCIRSRLFWS